MWAESNFLSWTFIFVYTPLPQDFLTLLKDTLNTTADAVVDMTGC